MNNEIQLKHQEGIIKAMNMITDQVLKLREWTIRGKKTLRLLEKRQKINQSQTKEHYEILKNQDMLTENKKGDRQLNINAPEFVINCDQPDNNSDQMAAYISNDSITHISAPNISHIINNSQINSNFLQTDQNQPIYSTTKYIPPRLNKFNNINYHSFEKDLLNFFCNQQNDIIVNDIEPILLKEKIYSNEIIKESESKILEKLIKKNINLIKYAQESDNFMDCDEGSRNPLDVVQNDLEITCLEYYQGKSANQFLDQNEKSDWENKSNYLGLMNQQNNWDEFLYTSKRLEANLFAKFVDKVKTEYYEVDSKD